MTRGCTEDPAGEPIFLAALLGGFLWCFPPGMERLGKGGETARRWIASANRPDAGPLPGLSLLPDQSTAGQGRVIKVR